MSPTEVNRAVADVLGEALSVVRQRGFSLLEPEYEKPANEFRDPITIDWDADDGEDWVTSIYEVAI